MISSRPRRNGFGLVARRGPRHQQEEQDVHDGKHARHDGGAVRTVEREAAAELAPHGDRHRAQVAKDQEREDERCEPASVQAAPITN